LIVIDTDVLIWLLRGNEKVKEMFKKAIEETEGLLYITPIQIAEIHAGMREKEREKTQKLLDSFSVIEIDKEIGKLAGEFVKRYGKSHSVKLADALIGAATIVRGMKLWTFNKKHYPMFNKKEFY
jgi:predicted nucleic acid-binding protein